MIVDKPHSQEFEQTVLGAIMQGGLEKDLIITAFESLTEESFYQPINKQIFNAISANYSKGLTVDLAILSDSLPQHKDYLIEIVRSSPGYANIGYYAKALTEKALERKMLDLLQMSQNIIGDKSISHNEKFDFIHKLLKDIDSGNSSTEVRLLSSYAGEVVEEVDDLLNNNKVAGLPTGYTEIDENIGGLVDGELITLGARPSVGKSALGMNIAENVAGKGTVVLYVTMEMTGKALAGRVICSQGRVNNAILKTPGRVQQGEWSKFSAGVANLDALPIHEASMSKPTASEIKAVARNFKRNNPLGLLVIDHLHLMRHDKSQGEVQGIGDTTSELKGLALELGVPVLLMSQLNRGNAKENRPPAITDLRGSGAIEQDSDIVMLIHRDDTEGSELKGKALVLIPKNRSGEKDAGIILANNLHTYRFDNYANVQESY